MSRGVLTLHVLFFGSWFKGLGTNGGGPRSASPCTPLPCPSSPSPSPGDPAITLLAVGLLCPRQPQQLDTFCEIGESEFVDAVIALQRFKAL